jgi:hypothetical protein
MPALGIALGNELIDGGDNRGPRHAQFLGVDPARGQTGAGRYRLRQDEALELLGQLSVQRFAVGPVETDARECGLSRSGLPISQ